MHPTCTAYSPGHNVHFVQAGLRHRQPGEIKKFDALAHDGNWLTVEMDGEIHRIWNHDPEKVREIYDAAVALRATPYTPHIPLYWTSVRLITVRAGRSNLLMYAGWDGPTECSQHETTTFLDRES